ncbi:MAG: M23 family metallopeptidase [Endomicrobiales bacterium]
MKKLKRLSLTCASLLLFASLCFAAEGNNPALEWDVLEKSVRDNKIEKYRAMKILREMRPLLDRYFSEHGGLAAPKSKWVFPLKYGVRNIEKYYVANRYDFFSSIRRNDHPALDLFIRDRDQDSRDDKTGRPVEVLSMSAGVVVAKSAVWEPGSAYRGGNYLWIYDPVTKALFYYAHLRDVFANVGDVVKPGTGIATVGRTGKNACKKRSRTHLHIMYLRYPENGYPHPRRIYTELLKSRLIRP